jgi:hypothetical protein
LISNPVYSNGDAGADVDAALWLPATEVADFGVVGEGFEPLLQPTADAPISVIATVTATVPDDLIAVAPFTAQRADL